MPEFPPITKIAVRGFKSILELQEIEIRPLTLLAGANSSGKSSFMQALLLLKQTIEAAGDPGGALSLYGENVRFTSVDQILSRKRTSSSAVHDFAIRLEQGERDVLETVFERKEGIGFDVSEMKFRATPGDKLVRLFKGMSQEEIRPLIPKPFRDVGIGSKNEKPKWSIERDRCFLSIGMQHGAGKIFPFGPIGFGPASEFIRILEGLIHLPGLRGNPQRTYPKSSTGPQFKGTFENYVASIITHWQGKHDARLDQLSRALEELGLSWKVFSGAINDTQVELRVGRMPHPQQGGAMDLVNIADVGFGVSQTLPVVVALVAARSGQIVYLEQPEIHLHPRAQRKLALVLRNAAERGVRVIAETHSSLLLREIQTLVARGELDRNKVKLHWFQRDEKDGMTKVTSADLDEHGAFGADWPSDFDDVELDAERSYLNAVESGNGK